MPVRMVPYFQKRLTAGWMDTSNDLCVCFHAWSTREREGVALVANFGATVLAEIGQQRQWTNSMPSAVSDQFAATSVNCQGTTAVCTIRSHQMSQKTSILPVIFTWIIFWFKPTLIHLWSEPEFKPKKYTYNWTSSNIPKSPCSSAGWLSASLSFCSSSRAVAS